MDGHSNVNQILHKWENWCMYGVKMVRNKKIFIEM